MKASSPLARLTLALLTLSLLLAGPAHAGHWAVTYECSGSSSYMKDPENDPKTTTGPFPNAWPTTFDSTTQSPPGADDYSPIEYYWPGYLGVDPDSDTRLLLSSASNSGSMVAVLTWTADSVPDTSPPPLKVNVIETATVVAAVDTVGHSYSVAASDSLGDVAVPISSGDGWNNYGMMASGRHLLAVSNPSGKQVLRLPSRSFSASASGDPDSNGFQEEFSQADVTYTVDEDKDPRAVTISSSLDAESPTWRKRVDAGIDANGDPVLARVPNQPDPDGSMHGDIGLDYGDNDYNAQYIYFDVTYTANPTGNWATNLSQYLWNTSLKNASYPGTLNGVPPDPGIQALTNVYRRPYILDDTQIPPVVYAGDAGSTSGNPQVDHLFFKYQNGDNRPSPWTPYTTGNDGDGAIATADYYLNLHQPYEFGPSRKSYSEIQRIAAPSPRPNSDDASLAIQNPGYATYGNGIDCTWNTPGAYWGIGSSALSVLSAAPYPPTLKWLGFACAAGGVTVDKLSPQADHINAVFSDQAWDDANSTFPGYPKGQFPRSQYHMEPRVYMLYKRTYTLKDDYDLRGYEGTDLVNTDSYRGAGTVFGNFVYAFGP